MSFDLERIPNMNAILATWNEDFKYREEASDYELQLSALLNEADAPQYVIVDMTVSSMSFNDIMFGIQRVSEGTTSLFKHPNAEQYVIVSTNKAIQMSANGLQRIGLGDLNVAVVGSIEEAKEHILQKVS